jgi:hypothetical protein
MLIGDKKKLNYNSFYRETSPTKKTQNLQASFSKKKPSPKNKSNIDPNVDYDLNVTIFEYSNFNSIKNKKN